jgi:hypothetical protein
LETILEFSKNLEQFKLKNKASLPFSPTSLILQELEKIVLFA